MAKGNKAQVATANDAAEQVSPEMVWDNEALSVEPTDQDKKEENLQDAPPVDEDQSAAPDALKDQDAPLADKGPSDPLDAPGIESSETEDQFKPGDKVFIQISPTRHLYGRITNGRGETECYGVQSRAFKSINKNDVVSVHYSRISPVQPEGSVKVNDYRLAPSGMRFLLKSISTPA